MRTARLLVHDLPRDVAQVGRIGDVVVVLRLNLGVRQGEI